MPPLKAAAARIDIPVNTPNPSIMGISNDKQVEPEIPLSATSLVIDADSRICIISCDALALDKETCDAISSAIEAECGIPASNIMVSATHTHHVPLTVNLLGIPCDDDYKNSIIQAAVKAAKESAAYLDNNPTKNEADAEFFFGVGNESTIGKNSRFILKDGGISWLDHKPEELVRPTGPMDPELPLILLKRPDGSTSIGIFNHSNHNIGYKDKPLSPGFYTLAARELEKKHGGNFIFLPGAFGSTHPLDLQVEERISRLCNEINEIIPNAKLGLFGMVESKKTPFTYRIRQFNEEEEDAAVSSYCNKYLDSQTAANFINMFRDMRKELYPHQGEERESVIQAIRLGDIAIIGVPGELFTSLGLEIKRRSPFRHTIIAAIANDYIGYLPDMKGFEHGGYQTWAGLQCRAEKGTGESIADAAIDLLYDICDDSCMCEPSIRDVTESDALALQTFYNSLDHEARVTFRPMGWTATFSDFEYVVQGAANRTRYDVVIERNNQILGWAFIAGFENEYPVFGIGVSKELRGKGFGKKIMSRVLDYGRRNRNNKGIDLTVVQTNDPARLLYESFGFRKTGSLDGGDGLMYYSMRLDFE